MDQMTIAAGGINGLDFLCPDPKITSIDFDFSRAGYNLCVTDTGGDHSEMTGLYASIRDETFSVARLLGEDTLRACGLNKLIENAAVIRSSLGDRAFLRAYHFFTENERVDSQIKALKDGRISAFLQLVRESGISSAVYLQNLHNPARPEDQGITVGLAQSSLFLRDDGAFRVHGGGFAGTILAFVPNSRIREYVDFMNSTFGIGKCRALSIRKSGALRTI